MYGLSVADLNLYLKETGKPEALIWNLNGSQVCSLLWKLNLHPITFLRT